MTVFHISLFLVPEIMNYVTVTDRLHKSKFCVVFFQPLVVLLHLIPKFPSLIAKNLRCMTKMKHCADIFRWVLAHFSCSLFSGPGECIWFWGRQPGELAPLLGREPILWRVP